MRFAQERIEGSAYVLVHFHTRYMCLRAKRTERASSPLLEIAQRDDLIAQR
jgi:hypothetical protein